MSLSTEMSAAALLRRTRLYVLLTQAHCRIPLLRAARQVIRGGADVVQLREKEMRDRELLRLAQELRRLTANLGVGFIVNDRPDIARLVGADGVHLGQEDLPPAAARRVLEDHQVLGVSTHSIEQARQATADGADYIGVGPVFPTPTKGYEQGVGLQYVQAAAEEIEQPLVAIGGITLERVREVLSAAGKRHMAVAVCSAVLDADDVEAATRAFKEAIDEAVKSASEAGVRADHDPVPQPPAPHP